MTYNFEKIKLHYNSIILSLFIFYSILPLSYKITGIFIFKPEILMSVLSIPIIITCNKSETKGFFVAILYIIYVLINVLLNLDSKSIFPFLLRILPFGIFPCIIGSLRINSKIFNKYLLIFCNLNFLQLIYISIIKKEIYLNKEFMSYMAFGYWVLISSLFYMYFYIIKKEWKYLLLNIISIIFILVFGSRFALLVSVLGSFILFGFVMNKRKIILLMLIIGMISSSGFYYLKDLLLVIIKILKNININIYSLERLVYSLRISSSSKVLSGRDIIYRETIDLISKNPLGVGILGFQKMELFKNSIIFYPHNIFLEFYLHYGVFAIVIIIILFLTIYNNLRRIEIFKNRIIIILLLILNSKLLLSGSYLWEPYFWLLLSLSFSLKKIRINKENKVI